MPLSESPLVSVVIPTYNRPQRLQSAIKTVESQSYTPIELVIIDDHSEVPASDVIDEGSIEVESLNVVRHDENRGLAAARNTGISRSAGKYIAFLDDDDRWKPTFIEQSVLEFTRSDCQLVYSGSETVTPSGDTIAVQNPTLQGDLRKEILQRNFISASAVVVAQEGIKEISGFDESLPGWEDWDCWIRLSQIGDIRSTERVLGIRTVNSEDQMSSDFNRIEEKCWPAFERKHQSTAREFGLYFYRVWYAWMYCNLGWSALASDNSTKAKYYLKKSIIKWPFKWVFWRDYLATSMGVYTLGRKVKARLEQVLNP